MKLSNDMKKKAKEVLLDILTVILAGSIVGTAYYFFQNSNNFAPGGVGGLATITYYLCGYRVSWSILMIAFNIPIFILVSIFVNKKLGIILICYMVIQSYLPKLYEVLGLHPYCLSNNPTDYEPIFACIMTGVISGVGFSIMLRRFGASGGTYAISSLIKKARPATNIAPVSFILDSSVVIIAFFVYGMKIAPAICTLINLFIANLVVDKVLVGAKDGYKFEIITSSPDELAHELLEKTHHGVTEIKALGMYSEENRYMLVCIVRKKQIGEVMKLIKNHNETFASVTRVNEVFGRFKS